MADAMSELFSDSLTVSDGTHTPFSVFFLSVEMATVVGVGLPVINYKEKKKISRFVLVTIEAILRGFRVSSQIF